MLRVSGLINGLVAMLLTFTGLENGLVTRPLVAPHCFIDVGCWVRSGEST